LAKYQELCRQVKGKGKELARKASIKVDFESELHYVKNIAFSSSLSTNKFIVSTQ